MHANGSLPPTHIIQSVQGDNQHIHTHLLRRFGHSLEVLLIVTSGSDESVFCPLLSLNIFFKAIQTHGFIICLESSTLWIIINKVIN